MSGATTGKCQFCGKAFTIYKRKIGIQKYCSTRCGNAGWYRENRERILAKAYQSRRARSLPVRIRTRPLESHCYLCHSYFPIDDFFKDKSRHSGVSSRCKHCDQARLRARTKKRGRGGALGTPATNRPFIPGGVGK